VGLRDGKKNKHSFLTHGEEGKEKKKIKNHDGGDDRNRVDHDKNKGTTDSMKIFMAGKIKETTKRGGEKD